MGIPEALYTMLSVIADTNTIRTWNIYPEKDGSITFKIKFNGGEPIMRDESIHYRRKPASQVRRDHQRVTQWRVKHALPELNVDHPGQSRPLPSDDVTPVSALNPDATPFNQDTTAVSVPVIPSDISTTCPPTVDAKSPQVEVTLSCVDSVDNAGDICEDGSRDNCDAVTPSSLGSRQSSSVRVGPRVRLWSSARVGTRIRDGIGDNGGSRTSGYNTRWSLRNQ